jgi:asparagine synthase (glutamine-hydrolysing)
MSVSERLLPEKLRRVRIAVRALAARTERERMDAWFSPFTEQERRQLLGPGRVGRGDELGFVTGGLPLQRMLYRDCFGGWLADNLLERGDRMSMAASLELRPPFLDHELVELAFSLPLSVKLRGGTGKWVIKELARKYLPAHIVDRPKAGFRVPLDAWFRGSLEQMAHDRLLSSSSFVSTVLDRSVVNSMLSRHSSRRSNEDMRIWTLLCLEIWHETFFKYPPFRPGTVSSS